jgi:putative transposase
LDDAYARFFSGDAGYPRPRRKFDNDSCRFPDPKQIFVSRGQIKLPKLGVVKAVIHRPIQGRVKSVTLARESDAFYAAVLVSTKVKALESRPMREVAFDVGVSQSAAEDDGTVHQAPTMSLGERKRKIRLQQALARKPHKASRRRKRVVAQLRRLEACMARHRREYCHQTSHRLTAKATHLAAEDLKIRNMTASAKGTIEAPGRNVRQKAGLNRAILNTAPGMLRRMVEYKASWRGTVFVCVDARHTSQFCSGCGQHPKDDSLTVDLAHGRVTRDRFECPLCGFTVDADVNAARNIRARGRLQWAAFLNSAAGYPVAARGGLCVKQAGDPRTKDLGSSRPRAA